jgi:hypothetical protein
VSDRLNFELIFKQVIKSTTKANLSSFRLVSEGLEFDLFILRVLKISKEMNQMGVRQV